MSEFRLMSRLILFALLTVIVAEGSAWAHGKEEHPGKAKMDQHMQTMMAR